MQATSKQVGFFPPGSTHCAGVTAYQRSDCPVPDGFFFECQQKLPWAINKGETEVTDEFQHPENEEWVTK